MTHPSLHSTAVCKGRNKAHKSHLSDGSRFLESCEHEGCRGVGGETADAMLPCFPAAASPLLYVGPCGNPCG